MSIIGKFLAASVIAYTFMSSVNRVPTGHSEPASSPVAPQGEVSLAPFKSVELRAGGTVVLRHGLSQRVTLLQGNLDFTQVTVADAGRLVIDKCKTKCPRGYKLEIEIVTPDIAGLSVTDGGSIQSRGNFPRQPAIGVAVSQGGTIDIRSIEADSVTASIVQGGRILISAQNALSASVVDGGIITYWGDARVVSSIQRGGDVTRGSAAEANQPLAELGSLFTATPAVPAIPKIPRPCNPRIETC